MLLTGDTCHSRWGWDHGVGPGWYSGSVPRTQRSLDQLEGLARRHPKIEVRLGHQR